MNLMFVLVSALLVQISCAQVSIRITTGAGTWGSSGDIFTLSAGGQMQALNPAPLGQSITKVFSGINSLPSLTISAPIGGTDGWYIQSVEVQEGAGNTYKAYVVSSSCSTDKWVDGDSSAVGSAPYQRWDRECDWHIDICTSSHTDANSVHTYDILINFSGSPTQIFQFPNPIYNGGCLMFPITNVGYDQFLSVTIPNAGPDGWHIGNVYLHHQSRIPLRTPVDGACPLSAWVDSDQSYPGAQLQTVWSSSCFCSIC